MVFIYYLYFLIRKDKIVYIGSTSNIDKRINQHLIDKNFDTYKYIETKSKDTVLSNESFYIQKYQPKLNINKMVTTKTDSELLDESKMICRIAPTKKITSQIETFNDIFESKKSFIPINYLENYDTEYKLLINFAGDEEERSHFILDAVSYYIKSGSSKKKYFKKDILNKSLTLEKKIKRIKLIKAGVEMVTSTKNRKNMYFNKSDKMFIYNYFLENQLISNDYGDYINSIEQVTQIKKIISEVYRLSRNKKKYSEKMIRINSIKEEFKNL